MTQINAAQNEQIAPLELITLEQIEVAVQAAQSAGATAGCGDVNMSHGQMTRLIASLGAVRPGELVPLLVRCWLESAWRTSWEANTPGPGPASLRAVLAEARPATINFLEDSP